MATGNSPGSKDRRRPGNGKIHAVGSLYGKDTKPYRHGASKPLSLAGPEPTTEELKAYKKPLNQIDPDTPGATNKGV